MMLVIIVSSIAVAAAICFAGMSSEDTASVDTFRRATQAEVAGNAKMWLEPPAFKQLG